MNGQRCSKSWLRTLPDDQAAVAVELIGCTRDVVLERMRDVEFANDHSFSVSVNLPGRIAASVLLRWGHGFLEVLVEGVSLAVPFVDRAGRCFTSVEVQDTPSIANTGSPIKSVQSIADRLDYWLYGLRSPFNKTIPVQQAERISRFLDKLAIAVDTSEPAWAYLHVEPCRWDPSGIIMVAFDNHFIELGIGSDTPQDKLHPELAADLLDLMNHYTEVRRNDVGHETDLRVQIGDMSILDCEPLDAVRKLRLYNRCSDRLTLYAQGPQ